MFIGCEILQDKILKILLVFKGFSHQKIITYRNKHYLVCLFVCFSPQTSGKEDLLIAGSERSSLVKS